jgi:hypothetical protein
MAIWRQSTSVASPIIATSHHIIVIATSLPPDESRVNLHHDQEMDAWQRQKRGLATVTQERQKRSGSQTTS